jgi:hypothetical protein
MFEALFVAVQVMAIVAFVGAIDRLVRRSR